MKQNQRYERRPQEPEMNEDFIVTVLRKTGERFFDQKHIKDLQDKQWEFFKGVPFVTKQALDKMLNRVMHKLHENHNEQIEQLRNSRSHYRLQSQPFVKKPHKPPNKQFNDNKIFLEYNYKHQPENQEFRHLYMDHIIEVINHINSKYHHKTFLTPYQVTDKGKGSERILKLSAFKADSDFVYMKQFNEQHLITKLTREQIIIWMWSFAHMITEMENIGVYHIDLEIRNTVKLHKIFRCIDFEYSFLFNQNTKSKVQQLLKRSGKSFPFCLIQNVEEDINQFKKNHSIPESISKYLNLLVQQSKKFDSYFKISYQKFEQKLKLNHKVKFLFILSKVIGYSGLKLKNDIVTIISIIEQLDFKKNDVQYKLYHQFIKALQEKYQNILTKIEVKPLKYLNQITGSKELRSIYKEKFYEFVHFVSQANKDNQEYPNYHTYLMPIETYSTHQKKLASECEVANTCQYINNVQSFWNLKKPRYLHYLFSILEQALEYLSKSNIYLTHLSISDFVKYGEYFKIWTLENALMLTSHVDIGPKIKSREFVQKFVETAALHEQKVIPLDSIANTQWFKKIKKEGKQKLEQKDYVQLQKQLRELKPKLQLSLLKQLLKDVPYRSLDKQAKKILDKQSKDKNLSAESDEPQDPSQKELQLYAIKDKGNCWKQLNEINNMLKDKGKQIQVKQYKKRRELIFEKIKKFKNSFSDYNSFQM